MASSRLCSTRTSSGNVTERRSPTASCSVSTTRQRGSRCSWASLSRRNPPAQTLRCLSTRFERLATARPLVPIREPQLADTLQWKQRRGRSGILFRWLLANDHKFDTEADTTDLVKLFTFFGVPGYRAFIEPRLIPAPTLGDVGLRLTPGGCF